MPSPSDTAYPRLKANPTAAELDDIYTPTLFELVFVDEHTRQPAPRLGLLLLLKTFQRLGYFVHYRDIPESIVHHIAQLAGCSTVLERMPAYDTSSARDKHMALVRAYVGVTAYGLTARRVIVDAALEAARTKDDLTDIINVAIEELVRQRYELPAFSTLLNIARAARARVNRGYQESVYAALDEVIKARLLALLVRLSGSQHSYWDALKQEAKRPTAQHLKEFIVHLRWLQQQGCSEEAFASIPDIKVRQFAAEARSLDLSSLNDMPVHKRLTLATALIHQQTARSLDGVAEMFIRQVQKLHNRARAEMQHYQSEHAQRADALVDLLRKVATAFQTEGTREERFTAIESVLGEDTNVTLQNCEAHAAAAINNHYAFLPRFYRSQRSAFFEFLEHVSLISTTQDQSIPLAIGYAMQHRTNRKEWLSNAEAKALDLSFAQDKWWPLVVGTKDKSSQINHINRRYFELCLFTQIMGALKSGDLCLVGSSQFNDYRKQLVSEEEYAREVAGYGERTGIPIDGFRFVGMLKSQLEMIARSTDDGFPANAYLSIEKGEPVLKRLRRRPDPEGLKRMERLIKERMTPVEIIDALADTEYWLNWTRHFSPISGHETKLDKPGERYLITTFCYGCGLGPSQTARSIPGLDRKQVAFINQRHVTEQKLNEAITTIINGYARFPLPRLWGVGTSASADGMKWELYSQNLTSEWHIRYGGYGGIGYYLVADSYIALFSRFSTCGSWEGHYILDFIQENASDVQPDTVHADTQGQSTAIFGLAHLLGIQLMPRIRNWKDLHFFRPSAETRYQHIDSLFTATIDWDLIETMLPDMLRVALSIKAGRITPSAILRRLATYSRKNKLYFAFRELGRVVRTIFLLRFLSDIDLRRTINAATNKSEAFNKFVQWVRFGGDGVIAENMSDEQRKLIKYNHLVANLLAFHTVVTMTAALDRIREEGIEIDLEAVAMFSPYQTDHINRFGNYTLNPDRRPESLDWHLRNLALTDLDSTH